MVPFVLSWSSAATHRDFVEQYPALVGTLHCIPTDKMLYCIAIWQLLCRSVKKKRKKKKRKKKKDDEDDDAVELKWTIGPEMGRVAIFLSDRVEHEVRASSPPSPFFFNISL